MCCFFSLLSLPCMAGAKRVLGIAPLVLGRQRNPEPLPKGGPIGEIGKAPIIIISAREFIHDCMEHLPLKVPVIVYRPQSPYYLIGLEPMGEPINFITLVHLLMTQEPLVPTLKESVAEMASRLV